MKILGKLKTAAPWLFMPFEIKDPVQVGTDREKVLDPYFTDWISNAASMVHHSSSETESEAAGGDTAEQQPDDRAAPVNEPSETDAQEPGAETAPLDIPEQQ